jgi:ABC-type transporter MlaC component
MTGSLPAQRGKASIGFAASLLAVMALAAPLSAKEPDQAAAVVNGHAILLADFQRMADPVLGQFLKTSPPPEQIPERVNEIKKRVLTQMIDDELLAQEAKNKSILVSGREVEDGVKKVRSRYKTEEEFDKEMSTEGMSLEDLRRHIRDQLSTS